MFFQTTDGKNTLPRSGAGFNATAASAAKGALLHWREEYR